MSLIPYTLVTVFLREGRDDPRDLVEQVRRLGLCARCLVTPASEGCFENGEVATSKILVLSTALPKKVEIIVPEADAQAVLDLLEREVFDGIVTVAPAPVVVHRTAKRLIPNHLQVRHVMNPSVTVATPDMELDEAAHRLVSGGLIALPVVDSGQRVVGVLSQRDLFQQGYLSLRAGLFAILDEADAREVLAPLADKTVGEVMTTPADTVPEDTYLPDAVRRLNKSGHKRLPAVDQVGRLTGLFARLDILKAVTHHTPGWYGRGAEHVDLKRARTVAEAMRPRPEAVRLDSSWSDLLDLFLTTGRCCIPVVDDGDRFLGLVFDRTLVESLTGHGRGLWDLVTGKVALRGLATRHHSLAEALQETRAEVLLERQVTTIRPEAPIEEAVRLIAATGRRYLPVVDGEGYLVGLVGRTDLLTDVAAE
jgi:CBS-domain-containing membrane protein/PII-like signaling protein